MNDDLKTLFSILKDGFFLRHFHIIYVVDCNEEHSTKVSNLAHCIVRLWSFGGCG